MIKRLAVLFFVSLLSVTAANAQKSNVKITTSGDDIKVKNDSTAKLYANGMAPIIKPARDFFMIQLGYNNWLNRPDSVKTKSFGYVFNTYLCYDFPIKKTKFSFAAGIGINANVVYMDKQRLVFTDTGANATGVNIIDDSTNIYKRFKFVTAYLQAPFELRYYSNTLNRNQGFKAAIGLQVGTLLGAHTKGQRSVNGTVVKEKVDTKRFVSGWNFAATARVGWGNYALFGSYNITNVFKDAQGPEVTPFSMGISISGL